MFHSWRGRSISGTGKASPRTLPRLEVLEGRSVLSTVTNLNDAGSGSLREAILNTPMGGTVDFQPGLTGIITLTSGELDINKDLIITGPGADVVTVSGNHTRRVFNITAPSTVTISGLTIADGQDNSRRGGGGIANAGMLTVIGSTLSGNSAPARSGGGISTESGGTAIVVDSTLNDNTSEFGGGIDNAGTLMITNSTISNNRTNEGGGGIANEPGGRVTISECTVTGNHGPGAGGGLLAIAPVTIRNTILAGNTAGFDGPEVYGTLDSQGHNLISVGDGGGGYTVTDLVGSGAHPIDPRLGRLQDNGGPTHTMALLRGSPALNAGDSSELGTPDQRGVLRTGGVNIGAYQASASAFLLSAPETVQSGMPFDAIVTAVDPFGQVAVGYTSTVTFSTSDTDSGVVLPAEYTFTADDGGVHVFTDTGLGELTLVTPGNQNLAVTDTTDDTINGNATIRVTNGNAPSTQDRFWTELAQSLALYNSLMTNGAHLYS